MSNQEIAGVFRQPEIGFDTRASNRYGLKKWYFSPVVVVGMAGDGVDSPGEVAKLSEYTSIEIIGMFPVAYYRL